MFAKLCNWALMGTLACLLSACGGGDIDAPAETAPSSLNAAAPNDVNAAYMGAAGGQQPLAYGQGGGSSAMQLSQQTMAVRANAQGGAMNGGVAEIAEVIRAQRESIPHVLKTRATNPEVADDDERDRMALREAEFERSFSMEKNRELAERRAIEGIAEPVGQQAYVPHEDCVDPRLPECVSHARMARY